MQWWTVNYFKLLKIVQWVEITDISAWSHPDEGTLSDSSALLLV